MKVLKPLYLGTGTLRVRNPPFQGSVVCIPRVKGSAETKYSQPRTVDRKPQMLSRTQVLTPISLACVEVGRPGSHPGL